MARSPAGSRYLEHDATAPRDMMDLLLEGQNKATSSGVVLLQRLEQMPSTTTDVVALFGILKSQQLKGFIEEVR